MFGVKIVRKKEKEGRERADANQAGEPPAARGYSPASGLGTAACTHTRTHTCAHTEPGRAGGVSGLPYTHSHHPPPAPPWRAGGLWGRGAAAGASAAPPSPLLPARVGIKTDSGGGSGRPAGRGGRAEHRKFPAEPAGGSSSNACATRSAVRAPPALGGARAARGPAARPRPGPSSPLLRAAKRKHSGQGRKRGAGRSAGRGSGTAGTAVAGRARGER